MTGKIVLLASGTRGDVQPYVALAQALRARKADAVVATHAHFAALAERCGVPVRLLADNLSDWLADHPGAFTPSAPLASLHFLRAGRAMLTRLIDSAFDATRDADVVVAGLPALWADSVAQARRARLVWGFLQPLAPTRAFASSLWPFRLGGRLSHRIVDAAASWPWRAVINRFRVANGLPPHGWRGQIDRAHADLSRSPVLYGYSAHLAPPPADWPAQIAVTGFWFTTPCSGALDASVQAFLAAGAEDTIYVGVGRGSVKDGAALLRTVERALGRLGLRAIVNVPGARLDSPRLLCVSDVDHAALFTRVRLVVHHAGAGTTAEALRAGVPSLVLPAFADQHFWATRLWRAGLAPPPLRARGLDAEALARAIMAAAALRPAAERMRALVRGEGGVAQAADRILLD